MGRTIPSITLAIMEEIEGWKPFRIALDKGDRKSFDDMTDIPHLYRSSCMMSANPIVIHPIFMSIIFHHYKQLQEVVKSVEGLA